MSCAGHRALAAGVATAGIVSSSASAASPSPSASTTPAPAAGPRRAFAAAAAGFRNNHRLALGGIAALSASLRLAAAQVSGITRRRRGREREQTGVEDDDARDEVGVFFSLPFSFLDLIQPLYQLFSLSPSLSPSLYPSLSLSLPLHSQSDPFAWGLCVAAPAAALFSGSRGAGGSNGLAAFAAASGNPFLSAAQCSAAAAAATEAGGACFSSVSSAAAAAAAAGAGGADNAAASAVPVAKVGGDGDSCPDGGDGDESSGRRFRFSAGAAMLPHPEKVARGGEDAFFVSDDGLTLGEKS